MEITCNYNTMSNLCHHTECYQALCFNKYEISDIPKGENLAFKTVLSLQQIQEC